MCSTCSTYIHLLCKNTSSIFCAWFNMFDIIIKLMYWVNRAEYDNSNSASGLQIGPLLRKLQAFICSTFLTYTQLLCMKTSSIFCAWFDMFDIRIKLMYWVNRGEYDNSNRFQIPIPKSSKWEIFKIYSNSVESYCNLSLHSNSVQSFKTLKIRRFGEYSTHTYFWSMVDIYT